MITIAKPTPKDMVLRGGLGAIGVGQAWMAATAFDRDNLEYAAAPEIALWTRRDLARAAWTMAGIQPGNLRVRHLVACPRQGNVFRSMGLSSIDPRDRRPGTGARGETCSL